MLYKPSRPAEDSGSPLQRAGEPLLHTAGSNSGQFLAGLRNSTRRVSGKRLNRACLQAKKGEWLLLGDD
jgi:hypothetical protein